MMDIENLSIRSSRIESATPRAVDLIAALQHAKANQDSLIKCAWEISQWLGREQLDQFELEDCLHRGRGIAYPNKYGEFYLNTVFEKSISQPVSPLFLHQSSSLGRLLAADPYQRWMVSTIACLFQFVRDEKHICQAVLHMIVENMTSADMDALILRDSVSIQTSVRNAVHIQLKAVVQKLVSSVWLHIINCEADEIHMPLPLRDICSIGHCFPPEEFGKITEAISTKVRTKAILRIECIFQDIVLWLLNHFDGLLVINVAGRNLFQEKLAGSDRELEVHIMNYCDKGSNSCQKSPTKSYEFLTEIAGDLESIIMDRISETARIPPQYSASRQPLYKIPPILSPVENTIWDKSWQIWLKCTAQEMLDWLFDIPLAVPSPSDTGFTLFVVPEDDTQSSKKKSKRTIANLMSKSPSYKNMNWGQIPRAAVVFSNQRASNVEKDLAAALGFEAGLNIDKQPQWNVSDSSSSLSGDDGSYDDDDDDDDDDDNGNDETTRQNVKISRIDKYDKIIAWFPILEDRIEVRMKAHCKCKRCVTNEADQVQNGLKRSGCMRRSGLNEIFFLIAHAIAEGFNVKDASSIANFEPIVDTTIEILWDLVAHKKINLSKWFGLAATVFLGCPQIDCISSLHGNNKAMNSPIAAIQFGNLAVQAAWLDMTREVSIEGLFELKQLTGQLAGISAGLDGQAAQIRSVEKNFAVILTEKTQSSDYYNKREKKPLEGVNWKGNIDEDDCNTDYDVILITRAEKKMSDYYYLSYRVKTDKHWRIVNPADMVIATLRSINTTACKHRRPTRPENARVYDFEDLLGRWPYNSVDADKNTRRIHMSTIIDSHFKRNVAMALSPPKFTIFNLTVAPCGDCLTKSQELIHASHRQKYNYVYKNFENGCYVINIPRNLPRCYMSDSSE